MKKSERTFNDRIADAGIRQEYKGRTDLGHHCVTLIHKGKRVPRPDVMDIEKVCKKEFGLII